MLTRAASVRPINYTDLAELYDVVNPAGAAIMREAAAEERRDEQFSLLDADGALGDVMQLLAKVPEASKSTKHTPTCWQTHAACLAQRLYNVIGDE